MEQVGMLLKFTLSTPGVRIVGRSLKEQSISSHLFDGCPDRFLAEIFIQVTADRHDVQLPSMHQQLSYGSLDISSKTGLTSSASHWRHGHRIR